MFAFTEGDVVIAERTTQGLVRDGKYKVVGVDTQVTPFGYFVTYMVEAADGTKLRIVNGHLILMKVPQ